ncbi:MAG TPA: GTPase HflX [Cytophagales bacterium]|jgi:GTP-binding protein HflX|nr:GTPase HflX [Cytophagales bacterium]
MDKLFPTFKEKEKAVLVAVINSTQNQETVKEYLDELEFLASTLGVETVAEFSQKIDKPEPRTFIGKGKVDEIKEFISANEVQLVIFDDDLSPSQLRNLEKYLKCRIYDRSLLILEIFLNRAQTSQAKTQVELARYQYLLPRLTRMWTHLERQRGGTGTRGGAGEKEIETDRRIIRNQINILKGKLEKIDKQNATQRKSRSGVVRVALVGYTNVGKSTLMNLMSKSKVHAENKLFATVDATVRKVVIDAVPFLLSDTVGFIRKLPHHLIESFKSTLNEVVEADILMHVIDISNPAYHAHMEVVKNTLADIGAGNKEVLYVFNKVDRIEENMEWADETEEDIEAHVEDLYKSKKEDEVYISAKHKFNIDQLREKLVKKIAKRHYTIYPNYLNSDTY